ncbi:MAG: MFS transporter [Acidobacteria bacterium]|nr:MFS transporter [Acidobacteriota bacterium]
MSASTDLPASHSLLFRLLRRTIEVEPEEVHALGWSWLYFFSVLSSYYVIRPIRDEMGVAGGVSNLPWLFTGTLIGMMLANPPFAALVARLPRAQFVSVTYRFFMGNLLLFFLLLQTTAGAQNIWVGRIFYIWTAVFNLFVVSVFWAFLVDVFTGGQGKRLFGFISAGGTLGGIAGSTLTAVLVEYLGPTYLLLISVALLEAAVFSVRRLSRISEGLRVKRGLPEQTPVIGGGVLAGISHTVKSPYLLNISFYMLWFTILSTFLYFQQAEIVDRTFTDRAVRTAFFARVDLLVNLLTFGIQIFLTGRTLKALGVALTLTVLPALSVVGFLTLGLLPTIGAIVGFQVLRRAGNFAIARPTREVLFTVLPREDRYKAKSFIDTFVYRAGDQIGAWSYALMGLFRLGIAGTSFVAVPIAIAWLLNGFWLGRKQEKLALACAAPEAAPSKAMPQPAPTPAVE